MEIVSTFDNIKYEMRKITFNRAIRAIFIYIPNCFFYLGLTARQFFTHFEPSQS